MKYGGYDSHQFWITDFMFEIILHLEIVTNVCYVGGFAVNGFVNYL